MPGGQALDGITSACAEKSSAANLFGSAFRNYLRMRGEEARAEISPCMISELPPHARRRDFDHRHRYPFLGITSACAEKSKYAAQIGNSVGNYLRMRGEEALIHHIDYLLMELPPHARRRVLCALDQCG